MRTNITNVVVLLSLNLAVLACSKLESNDMVFKSAVSSESLSSPTESAQPAPSPAPAPAQEDLIVEVTDPTTSGGTSAGSSTGGSTDGSATAGSTDGSATAGSTAGSATAGSTAGSATAGATTGETAGGATGGSVGEPEVIYPETDIPNCKLDLTVRGLGSAAKVIVASAPKADLLGTALKGFESLSSSELSAMKNAIETSKSGNGVQYLAADDSFDKQFFKDNAMVLVVINSASSKLVDMGGLGKDAQIYIMNVSQEHNTVCVRTDGNSSMNELSMSVLSSAGYASRGSLFINGNGSINSYLKVMGGHRSGSSYEGKSISDSNLTFITEGKNDTFTSVKGNNISTSKFDIKIKGNNQTGFGMNSEFINDSEMRMEIQGEDDVRAIMGVKKMSGNDISGWLKAKSGGEVDPSMSEYIEIMPLP